MAEKYSIEERERLLRERKLDLLVDLDQTLLHTTNSSHYYPYSPVEDLIEILFLLFLFFIISLVGGHRLSIKYSIGSYILYQTTSRCQRFSHKSNALLSISHCHVW